MSESEVALLRREIRALSDKADRQHADNQRAQQAERDAFRTAIQTQQTTFQAAMETLRNNAQEALNKQFALHNELDKTVERHALLLVGIIGENGAPGEGRVGILENGMETMKKFRWQALSIVSIIMWVAEVYLHGHGH